MRRRHVKKDKNRLKLIIISIIIVIASFSTYYFLINPKSIVCGILIDKKESSRYIELKLYAKGKNEVIMLSKKKPLPDAPAYNVKMRGLRVISIVPCTTYGGKILSRDSKTIETENGKFSLTNDISYVKLEDKNVTPVGQNDIIVGYSSYNLISDNNGKIGAVIVGKPDINFIRVGISNSDFKSLDHKTLTFFSVTNSLYPFFSSPERTGKWRYYSGNGLIVKYENKEASLIEGDLLNIDYKDGSMELSVLTTDKNGNLIPKSKLGKTKNRVYISSTNSSTPVYIKSLTRANEHKPVYYGSFEVFIKDSAMRLINEVDLEHYLKFVVPSEMLPSGGIEAYRTQAIAARTYVLSDMLSGRFAQSGFHVDDTTMSQAYNMQPSVQECDKAIEDTKGMVITYKNRIIDAKYYSTSCGVGAPFNEIYYESTGYSQKNNEPYLAFNNFTDSKINDLSDESKASTFFMDWTIKSYDSNSPYFRWKYSMDKKTLNTTINKNIYSRYQKNPSTIKKKWYFNFYRPVVIPSGGIGNILDISINKRGSAGNVMEMLITSDTGTYKIIGETSIKRILTPDDLEITPLYGKTIKSFSALPSPFFVIDKQFSGSKVKSITVYGGGYGHGVGMSQYGAIGLVHQGKSYKDIINIFYKDIELVDYKEALNNSL